MVKTILDFLNRRMPARNDIFLALSMAVFIIFSWSLRALFFNLPSFRLSHTNGEILIVAAYTLMIALFESLFVTFGMAILAVLLPGAILKEGFSYKASYFLIASAIIFIHVQSVLTNQTTISYLVIQFALMFAIWLGLVLLTVYVGAVRKIVLDVLDRLTIFSYIYIPLGVVSMLVVFVRLLW